MCMYFVFMYVCMYIIAKLGVDDGSCEPAANEAKSVGSVVSQAGYDFCFPRTQAILRNSGSF